MSIYDCKAYAAYLKNENELVKSTSGGAFFAFASFVISQGGVVFGAAYDEEKIVRHRMVETIEDLETLRGSKYIQSRIGNSYKMVLEELRKDRWVLFSGTPCQIAGLHAFLGNKFEKLLTVDLICHGVPSDDVFKYHLAGIEKKYGQVDQVTFRDNTIGWESSKVSYKLMSGGKVYQEVNQDAYYVGFDRGYFLRPSCYTCPFRGLASGADITIGDYWAIRKEHPDFYNNNGVSAIIVKTEQGEKVFEQCKSQFVLCESTVAKIANYNILVVENSGKRKSRKRFFEEYHKEKTTKSLEQIQNDMNRKGFSQKIGIIGSYNSRLVAHALKQYDENAEIVWHITNTNIMSLVSEKVDLGIDFDRVNNAYRRNALKNDFLKESINMIEQNKCDFILIDLLEERLSNIILENGIITKSEFLSEITWIDFEKKGNEISTIQRNQGDWERSCIAFIEKLKSIYNMDQIILNELYLTENIGLNFSQRKHEDIDNIKAVNQVLKGYYDFIKKQWPEIRWISIEDELTDFTYEDFEYGVYPYYLNRRRYNLIKDEIVNIIEE